MERPEIKLDLKASDLVRGLSIGAHVILGANAACRNGDNPIMGIPSALLLESLAHSQLPTSLAGGTAVAAGYAPLAIASLDLKPLAKWFEKQWNTFKYRFLVDWGEDYKPPREEVQQEFYGEERSSYMRDRLPTTPTIREVTPVEEWKFL